VNHSEIVSFLWGVADLIGDTFKRGKYQDVILPLTCLEHVVQRWIAVARVALGKRLEVPAQDAIVALHPAVLRD
jgi:hypothetical protein